MTISGSSEELGRLSPPEDPFESYWYQGINKTLFSRSIFPFLDPPRR
jgi:hypothetical protein